jgi:hypothetical protein
MGGKAVGAWPDRERVKERKREGVIARLVIWELEHGGKRYWSGVSI